MSSPAGRTTFIIGKKQLTGRRAWSASEAMKKAQSEGRLSDDEIGSAPKRKRATKKKPATKKKARKERRLVLDGPDEEVVFPLSKRKDGNDGYGSDTLMRMQGEAQDWEQLGSKRKKSRS